MNWFTKSNRNKHFWYGMILGFFLTLIAPITAGFVMEYKDKQWGGNFDKNDIYFTISGGIIGQIVQIFILKLFITN